MKDSGAAPTDQQPRHAPLAGRRVAVACLKLPTFSETFIRAHIDRFSGRIPPLHGIEPMAGTRPVFNRIERLRYRLGRRVLGEPAAKQTTEGYVRALRQFRPDAVLAEYGEVGVRVMDACARLSIPLVVHFHGYDASQHAILEAHRQTYPRLFRQAVAVIGVSREMVRVLGQLGCPPEKLHYIPCGVDCDQFSGANPAAAAPRFLAVGRFVEKKGPLTTIAAFKAVAARTPEATLCLIGDGPLRAACELLIRQLRLEGRVTLLGVQPPERIAAEMREARAFVQHSLEAASGDREGTPVAVMEASVCGLPVVATRHAGIPDIVLDGRTGLLVDEGDAPGMAAAMQRLAEDPSLAATLGRAARERVCGEFSAGAALDRLGAVLAAATECSTQPALR
jgi:glycosyltransferase involved in cell wall biosynthesis